MLFILVFARVVIRVIQLTLSARRERVQFSITIPYVLCSRTILSFLAVVASRKSPIIQVKKNKFFALEKNATPPLSFEKRISWKASIALCDRSEPLTRADDSFPSRTRATTELRLARRTDGRGRNLWYASHSLPHRYVPVSSGWTMPFCRELQHVPPSSSVDISKIGGPLACAGSVRYDSPLSRSRPVGAAPADPLAFTLTFCTFCISEMKRIYGAHMQPTRVYVRFVRYISYVRY